MACLRACRIARASGWTRGWTRAADTESFQTYQDQVFRARNGKTEAGFFVGPVFQDGIR